MNRIRGYINLDLGSIFVALLIVGAVVGWVLAYAVPWLWSLIKPLIHALTA